MTSARAAITRKSSYGTQVHDLQKRFEIDTAAVSSLCAALLRVLDQPPCTLSVVFVGPRRMRVLNRQYRGRDHATDVLSFSYPGEADGADPLLGEIVICPEVAQSQAGRWRTPLDKEIRRLIVHGILHLLGHDHETDQGEMMRFQRRLLRRRFAAGPPIMPGHAQR